MAQETEVISCPACKHLLRVPLEWLGQNVQCPECRATFKAPVKVGDRLTEPELISRPPAAAPARRKKFDAMLLLPAFGLMLCGAVGMFVNGGVLSRLILEDDGGREWVRNEVSNLHAKLEQIGYEKPAPAGTENERNEQDAAQLLRLYRWFVPLSVALSLGVFLGGLSMTLRWNYRLAQVSCILAALNFAYGCFIPGAVIGLWGILMLNSEEGRGHFGR